MSKKLMTLIAVFFLFGITSNIQAEPVTYSFTTVGGEECFGDRWPPYFDIHDAVTGTFVYDNEYDIEQTPMPAGSIIYKNAIRDINGSIGTGTFSDPNGQISVGDQAFRFGTNMDWLMIRNNSSTGTFNGFTSYNYSLTGIRMYWMGGFDGWPVPDFLDSNDLPTPLPLVDGGTLQLIMSNDITGENSYLTFACLQVTPLSSVLEPDIDVQLMTYDFGNVQWMGEPQSVFITISNTGNKELNLTDISFEKTFSDFTVTPIATSKIEPGTSIDLEVVFAPSYLGYQDNSLNISSDDPDEPSIAISFGGVGVLSDTPSEQVADVITFIEESVNNGDLIGVGNGNSANNKIKALKNMVEAFGDLINDGLVVDGCSQLLSVYKKVDGNDTPPDFVSGPATDELRNVVNGLLALYCEGS